MRRAAACLLLVACNTVEVRVLPQPIRVSIDHGVLAALGSTDDAALPFPMLLDSGAAISVYDDVAIGVAPATETRPQARVGDLRLWSVDVPPIPRLDVLGAQLFRAPLAAVGLDGDTQPISGIFGGDNLTRLALGWDLRAPAPTVRFLPSQTTCGCDLADQQQAVLPFVLAGGQNTLVVAGDLFTYPPTRAVLEACVEPIVDPVSRGVPCIVDGGTDPAYLPSGADMRLAVATGFPGLLLAASAWDRLRGPGSAAALLAAPDASVHLADGRVVPAARATLGGGATSLLALVSRELVLGPCAELARSRRQRRFPPFAGIPETDPLTAEKACLRTRDNAPDAVTLACAATATAVGKPQTACDDTSVDAPTAAIVELLGGAEVLVADDSVPPLVELNEDVRPAAASVDGLIGPPFLRRLVATLNFRAPDPNDPSRLIARCASDADCIAYRRYVVANDCSRACTPPAAAYQAPLPGGRCVVAP